MDDDGGGKRQRAGSISGRLRTASDLEQCGFIDHVQKGVLKDMIISGDSTLQGALDKYEKGDASELEAIIKSGTLADRRSSIDLLDGLDLDFLGNSLGDSFDGFEFDGAVNECVSGNMNVFDSEGDKFRYRSDSSVVDQDMLEERNHVTGERMHMHGHGHGHTQSHTHTQSSNGGGGGDDMMDAIQQFHVKSEGVGMASSGGAQKPSTYTTDTSQGGSASSNLSTTVGYDPLFSSGITYEEQRLRAGSFHTDQQRARANSLMMDPHRMQGDPWQRNPPQFNQGTAGGGAFQPPFPSDMDMYNNGGGDMFGGSGGVGGSFGASPDIDYGMGIYEQRLRGNSFQQVNDQRLRAGSFQLYPQQQQQQQQTAMRGSGVPGASGSMMPPSGSRPGYLGSGSGSGSGPTTATTTAVPPSATSSSVPGEKRMVNQVDAKALTSHTHSHAPHSKQAPPQSQSHQPPHTQQHQPHYSSMYQSSQPHSQGSYSTSSGNGNGNGRVDSSTGESMAGYVGTYSPEARKERINRFIEKRKNRVWTKKVKYDVRKNFADSRIRVKGRFVKKEDEEKMRLQLGEEEWARVVAKSQGLA